MRSGFLVVFLSVFLLLIACSQGDQSPEPVLRFSALPDQRSTQLQAKIRPLATHLSEQLGVRFEYVPSRDYQASVEMFKNGDIHLAWFGGLTGVQARRAVPGARAIAQGAADPEYYSYFIAHESTGLQRSESFPMELAGLTFTFGSESSTSGRLMPEYFLRAETGKGPMDFFTDPPGFSGSHDRTVELVESGQYQAGVVNYKVYERRVTEGETDPEHCRVIWQTPFYADYNWTAHPELDQVFGTGFIDRLQAALVAIDDPVLLRALPRERLITADNDDFADIQAVAMDLGMLR